MKNIKKITLGLAVLSALSMGFTGCGSDSDDDAGSANSNGSVNPTDNNPTNNNPSNTNGGSTTPTGSYSCDQTVSHGGKTLTMKLGATGKLTCSELYGYPELKFVDGINEMVISQLTSTLTFDSNYATGTETVNLANGTEHIVGTDTTHGSVDCVNTYDVNLPITIYDADDINNFDLGDYQLLSSTCPSWIDDDDYDDPTRATMTLEATVTEQSGDISTISSYFNY